MTPITLTNKYRIKKYKEFISKWPDPLKEFLKLRLMDFSINLQLMDLAFLSLMKIEHLDLYRMIADQYTVEEICFLEKMWYSVPVIGSGSVWRNGFSPARYHYVYSSNPVSAHEYRMLLDFDPFTERDRAQRDRYTICGGPPDIPYSFSSFVTEPLEEMPLNLHRGTWRRVVALWRLEIGK
ncbi:MAG: hypothetical protein GF334_01090 [Candidatus Altiarchaeales archaeon]|nr:hypothetical protein [Candidatus Altiarchaeales archaeon]